MVCMNTIPPHRGLAETGWMVNPPLGRMSGARLSAALRRDADAFHSALRMPQARFRTYSAGLPWAAVKPCQKARPRLRCEMWPSISRSGNRACSDQAFFSTCFSGRVSAPAVASSAGFALLGAPSASGAASCFADRSFSSLVCAAG